MTFVTNVSIHSYTMCRVLIPYRYYVVRAIVVALIVAAVLVLLQHCRMQLAGRAALQRSTRFILFLCLLGAAAVVWGAWHVYEAQVVPQRDARGAINALVQQRHEVFDSGWDPLPMGGKLHLFKECDWLTVLVLRTTGVTDADIAELPALPNLRTLDISGNSITDAGLANVERFDQLVELSLAETEIRRPCELSRLKGLEVLDVGATDISESFFRDCFEGTQLRSLRLAFTKVSDEVFTPVSQYLHLEELSVRGTAIDGRGLRSLAGHPSLRVIDLHGTRVSDVVLADLMKIPRLEVVDLGETQVSAEGVRMFRANRPMVKVR